MRTIQVKTTDQKGRRRVRKVVVETKEESLLWRKHKKQQATVKNADK